MSVSSRDYRSHELLCEKTNIVLKATCGVHRFACLIGICPASCLALGRSITRAAKHVNYPKGCQPALDFLMEWLSRNGGICCGPHEQSHSCTFSTMHEDGAEEARSDSCDTKDRLCLCLCLEGFNCVWSCK